MVEVSNVEIRAKTPCPFCGGRKMRTVKVQLKTRARYTVSCERCKARVTGRSVVEVITHWETRVDPKHAR